MKSANKPLNKVVPQYTQTEAQKRTNAFVAYDGAWTRLVNIKNDLSLMLEEYLQTTDSPYETMNKKEIGNVLVGHFGLLGEFGNSVETVIAMQLKENFIDEPLDVRLQHTVEAFEKRSQLTGINVTGREIALKHAHLPRDENGQPVETKSQALQRCADDVERWLEHNKDALPQGKAAFIAENLADYRGALKEVEEYVGYAKDYLAQRKETHILKNNDIQL